MNDFTKEELEIICEMSANIPVGTYINGAGKLLIKVKSLIDNCCEHESSIAHTTMNIRKCIKCEEIF